MIRSLLASISFAIIIWAHSAFAWSYPVQEVEGNFCEGSGWVCKIELPRILKADYLKYQSLAHYRQIYTVMWGGSYFGGRDFGFGSHQGVDIASPIGTPISAIGSGEVVLAQEKGEWGKVVVIKHLWKGIELHSVYAHLDEILVKVGDMVNEKQVIAKMGATGNTTWPHLHLQIDLNQGEHPFFPKNCGGTIAEVVNEARCRSQIKVNTLDPILFLETEGSIFLAEQGQNKVESQNSDFISPSEIRFELERPILKIWNHTQVVLSSPKSKEAFLDSELRIESGSGIDLFPNKISYIGEGRTITLAPRQEGLHRINFLSWDKLIKSLSLFVLEEKQIDLLREKSKTNPALAGILKDL